jgi:adenylate cyclase
LAAVSQALALTDDVNAERAREHLPAIEFGIALHLGRVSYGNIGSRSRLDFTVIGPAVNHAARIGGMCRTLDRTVLASAAFARTAPAELISLGMHPLRGVPDPHELFTLG